jgi:hypothetical protein
MGSENSADHAWDFLSNWFWDMGGAIIRVSQDGLDAGFANFIDLPGAGAGPWRAPARVLVFDACQTGVILRAVLFVEAV